MSLFLNHECFAYSEAGKGSVVLATHHYTSPVDWTLCRINITTGTDTLLLSCTSPLFFTTVGSGEQPDLVCSECGMEQFSYRKSHVIRSSGFWLDVSWTFLHYLACLLRFATSTFAVKEAKLATRAARECKGDWLREDHGLGIHSKFMVFVQSVSLLHSLAGSPCMH